MNTSRHQRERSPTASSAGPRTWAHPGSHSFPPRWRCAGARELRCPNPYLALRFACRRAAGGNRKYFGLGPGQMSSKSRPHGVTEQRAWRIPKRRDNTDHMLGGGPPHQDADIAIHDLAPRAPTAARTRVACWSVMADGLSAPAPPGAPGPCGGCGAICPKSSPRDISLYPIATCGIAKSAFSRQIRLGLSASAWPDRIAGVASAKPACRQAGRSISPCLRRGFGRQALRPPRRKPGFGRSGGTGTPVAPGPASGCSPSR